MRSIGKTCEVCPIFQARTFYLGAKKEADLRIFNRLDKMMRKFQ